MIIICGGIADSVTELVCARLENCGYPYRLVDLAHYPSKFQIDWRWNGSCPTGYIAADGWKLDLEEITGVYIRYLGREGRAAPDGADPAAVQSLYSEYDSGLMALFEDLPCTVVNRIGESMSNSSKPYQGMLALKAGLLTPPTLVTNDPDEVHAFYEENNGEIIYKSLSGIRSIVRKLDKRSMKRLKFLRFGPAQFQKFIPGNNIRVHTIGDEVFPTMVQSESVDYRYARREKKRVEMEAIDLPTEIEEACFRIARQLDLEFAGIDLKLTPDGDFYCFEVNPCPGFIYYERHTGQPISKALADVLFHGRNSGKRSKAAAV